MNRDFRVSICGIGFLEFRAKFHASLIELTVQIAHQHIGQSATHGFERRIGAPEMAPPTTGTTLATALPTDSFTTRLPTIAPIFLSSGYQVVFVKACCVIFLPMFLPTSLASFPTNIAEPDAPSITPKYTRTRTFAPSFNSDSSVNKSSSPKR